VASTTSTLAPGHPLNAAPQEPQIGEKGLKTNAIGFLSNMVIGVASTAPAYSLAATLGFIVAVGGVGVHAPAVLIVSFIPMLLISFGYRYLNRADPDAGTTFAWVTRALGPQLGWLNGWAIFVADVIVMASLSVIASTYTYRDQALGVLGVVGPRRMAYSDVISLVEETARLVSDSLSRVKQQLYLPS